MSDGEKEGKGEQGRGEEEAVLSCSLENLKKISEASEKGALVVFTAEGCPYCPPFLEEAEKALGDDVTIVEAGVEDAECMGLAEQLGVKGTPTAFYYVKGEQKKMIVPEGKTWDEIRKELEELKKGA